MNDLPTLQRINNAIQTAKSRKRAKALNGREQHVKRATSAIARAQKIRTGQ
jgi:hypothetical protein